MATLKERRTAEALKRAALREIAERPWNFGDLLTIFGMAFRLKISQQNNQHNGLGKHYFGKHQRGLWNTHNPAGTKLVRGFIRRSGRESTSWRNLYKELTGKHYGSAEA